MRLRDLEAHFCKVYLWPDEEWLEFTGDGFTYHPGRLAQNVTTRDLGDGRVSWRLDMPLVGGVEDEALAVEVCLALNAFACGWSFAYDRGGRSVHALAALAAPPEWDRHLLRLAQAAKLAGWFGESVVDALAHALGGTPLVSHPSTASGPRRTPDALTYLPTALRERPEWVFDPVPYTFGDLDAVAAFFADRSGVPLERAQVAGDEVRLATSDHSALLVAGFDVHPLLGAGWRSDVRFTPVPDVAFPVAATAAAWSMFEDPGATLLGAWVTTPDGLAFRQWSLTTELRGFEQLPGWPGPVPEVLWSVTSTATDAVRWAGAGRLEHLLELTAAPDDVDRAVATTLGALHAGIDEALATVPGRQDGRADRHLLWLDDGPILLLAGWFNPVGPTLSTLEHRRDPATGAGFLVAYTRHPMAPRYVVVARADTADDVRAALPYAMAEVLAGSPPNVMSVAACPDELRDAVLDAVRAAAHRQVAEAGTTFDDLRRHVLRTLGDPWGYAGEPRPEGHERAVPHRVEGAYEAWLAAVCDDDNFAANVMQLPQAWDGSLNYQAAAGNLNRGVFDIGPFLLVHSDIGRAPAAGAGQPSG